MAGWVSKLDRRAVFASGAAAALLAATGVSAGGLPRRGGQLRLALSGASRQDSWRQGDGLFMQVARLGLVFDTLTEVAADGTLRGELATAWHSSSDACQWEFELRSDVCFHDSAAFGPRDVVSSLRDRFDVRVAGARSVAVTLNDPDPNLPFRLAEPGCIIRPDHAPDAGIGTGLYRVHRFRPGQQLITLRVAEHYKGDGAGWFDRVELVSVPAEAARAQAMRECLVDGADLSDVSVLNDVPDVHGLTQEVVGRHIGAAARIGASYPFDDLRAPERWWII